MWTTAITDAGIVTFLILITNTQLMRAPEAYTLGKIPGGAIGRALGRLDETTTDGGESLSLTGNHRHKGLSAVNDLVEVVETSFIEVVLALAE